ncbi:efflux RND transporter periplasmic adaptor subunit [Ralstonia insidiosa]|uniref:Efflux transporter periplasmic adaptor subunit n=1 Tax=Ralstonia insidiosa TaxID=190721 RepID=A0A192A6I9_9RALS|nr:efflux RND transporter periplasmic adaptor subunit [Ralstonia insidiosa]ANJ76009.1 efflux transporter periplasmic adaptor subunit [Ralstonia insidiosa]KAB0469187.1 efflux RND transporter periplasmic adaptor subunit [Ralstonia insidiosa]MBY4909851.1 efflux RND transporter periplasmic adaptor subunit [Ralstonia insidiosa]
MLSRRFVTSTAVLALPLALIACGERAPADPRTEAPLVRAAFVQPVASASRSFTGVVAARVQSDLGFRVPGKVLERLVDAGQTVKRGQPLMRIDPVDLKLAAHAQQETVAAAKARAQQTAEDEARYRDLRGTGAISASAYDQAKAAADAAKAQLSAAEAQADVARNASRYAELVADGDGVVMETLAEPGQVVSAGQAVVRLAHAGRREAVVQLPETLRPAIGSVAQATLFGKESDGTPAKLRQLSDAADRLTRTYEARYVLDGELANAPLGSTVTIQIPDRLATVQGDLQVLDLQVPLGAVFDAGKGPGVWVIQGDPAKVSWRSITIVRLGDEGARVAGQVKQGDRIVALGAQLLREGQQVRVAGQGASPAIAGVRL